MSKIVVYEGPADALQVEDERGKRVVLPRGEQTEVSNALAKAAEGVEGHKVKVESPK